ncbi:transmembrane protein 268 isoform X4 [Hypomesus transpacificus]|uniref:transmembrane protein 268 isoform X4 n=1 Tax=Hypomesus transpacificus TaxID=137520 RepID=UPI001F08393A|nr:transmembrane protein 268 isoform X4 [Hypomesus transpacificus]
MEGDTESDVDMQPRHAKAQTETETNRSSRYTNGQCVLAVPSSSMLVPGFDLTICRALLEKEGFQIPVGDFESPLKTALDHVSVRRYLLFNSSFFHLILAPVIYIVFWCAVYSTLHLYLSITDYWVLYLSVSLVSILLTTAIVLRLHNSNKKLFCVYWDMTPCLRALTETVEDLKAVGENKAQKKLKKRMSHLLLVSEVMNPDPEVGSRVEEGSDEERPLLPEQKTDHNTSNSHREDTKLTTNYSLVPELRLPSQAVAQQLLLTYSAAYVKLLVSESLPLRGRGSRLSRRSHCPNATLCLCQYIQVRVLRC